MHESGTALMDTIEMGAGIEPSQEVRLTELGSGVKRVLLEGLTQGLSLAATNFASLTRSGQRMCDWLPSAIERVLKLVGESTKDPDQLEELLRASEPRDGSLLEKELQAALRRLVVIETKLRGMSGRRERRAFAKRLVRQITGDVNVYLQELETELVDILRQRTEEEKGVRIDASDDPLQFPLFDCRGEVVGILVHRDLAERLDEALGQLNAHEVVGLVTYLNSHGVDDLDAGVSAHQLVRWGRLSDEQRAEFRQSALDKVRGQLRDLITIN